jgi:hypothetical protein
MPDDGPENPGGPSDTTNAACAAHLECLSLALRIDHRVIEDDLSALLSSMMRRFAVIALPGRESPAGRALLALFGQVGTEVSILVRMGGVVSPRRPALIVSRNAGDGLRTPAGWFCSWWRSTVGSARWRPFCSPCSRRWRRRDSPIRRSARSPLIRMPPARSPRPSGTAPLPRCVLGGNRAA